MIPLISCICVTADRPRYLETAIDCFLSQDWPSKELIVVDDGKEEIAPILHRRQLSYTLIRSEQKLTIGEKRNQACAVSRGEIIAHFDDDDWSSPHRITDQVERLLSSKKSVTGYNEMLFFDEDTLECFRYISTSSDYAIGTSLCYLRSLWAQHPFTSGKEYEDNVFNRIANGLGEVISVPGEQKMVARIHKRNTAPKQRGISQNWHRAKSEEMPAAFVNAITQELAR